MNKSRASRLIVCENAMRCGLEGDLEAQLLLLRLREFLIGIQLMFNWRKLIC